MPTSEHAQAPASSRKRGESRSRLITAAAQLFQEQGYAATGLSEILDRAKMPKGSLYHHFPGGKVELGAAAMERAGQVLQQTLAARLDSRGPRPRHPRLLPGSGWMA